MGLERAHSCGNPDPLHICMECRVAYESKPEDCTRRQAGAPVLKSVVFRDSCVEIRPFHKPECGNSVVAFASCRGPRNTAGMMPGRASSRGTRPRLSLQYRCGGICALLMLVGTLLRSWATSCQAAGSRACSSICHALLRAHRRYMLTLSASACVAGLLPPF